MKSSNKFALILSGIFTLFIAAQAFALPTAGDEVIMEYNGSVPYTMIDVDTSESFLTFCLEKENFFTPYTSSNPVTYNVVSVGEVAYGGGVSTYDPLTETSADLDPRGDPLSEETKWVYAAYMSGAFNMVATADQIQNVIWWLEGELYKAEYASLASAAETLWDNTLKGNTFVAKGWEVIAVNISNGGDAQSQLVGAPVPEPATLFLFGTGLAGLAGTMRSRRKKKDVA